MVGVVFHLPVRSLRSAVSSFSVMSFALSASTCWAELSTWRFCCRSVVRDFQRLVSATGLIVLVRNPRVYDHFRIVDQHTYKAAAEQHFLRLLTTSVLY